MRVATLRRPRDDAPHPHDPTTGARRARYSRASATRRLTLRTDACGSFPPRRPHLPSWLAVGEPHAVVPNFVSTPRPRWPVLTRRRMAGFEVATEGFSGRRLMPVNEAFSATARSA